MLERLVVDFFNVHRIPRHLLYAIFPVLEKHARVDALLRGTTSGIQREAL